MDTRRTSRFLVAASIAAAAGLPVSALAQEAPATVAPVPAVQPATVQPVSPSTPPPEAKPAQDKPGEVKPGEVKQPDAAGAQSGAVGPAAQPEAAARPIRFNFKDMPFDQALDFFARESGLPTINEAPIPQGAITFISGDPYSFEDALTILNLNLVPKGVVLVREKNFLYLRSLKDSARKANEVYKGSVPAEARPEEMINLTIPLSNATADLVAKQIQPLVGEYGSVVAVPAQNMVIVVETAAQCRRIQEIVQSIDQVRPVDSAYRLFPLKYAKADACNTALKGLLGERTRQVFIDKDGKQTVVQDVSVAGLSLQPDPRTNSIIAVGSESRIKVVEELLALLDVPEGGLGEQKMMTVALDTISPQVAATELGKLFANVDQARRPTIIPLPDAGKLTVVGPASLVLQAMALLGELDPGTKQGAATQHLLPERRAGVIKLTYITPQSVEQLAQRLLTQRQQSVVKFGPAPDGRGLIVTGPEADVTAFENLVKGIDVAPDVLKEVRQVRIAAGDPKAILDRANQLHEATGRNNTDPVTVSLDAESRTVTLIGGRAAIERFADLLRNTEQTVVVDLESRTYELAHAKPSVLGGKLVRVVKPLLTPDDGSAYTEPKIEPVDELRTLIVRALPSQFAVLDKMVKQLDQDEPGSQQHRFVRLNAAAGDPQSLVDRVQRLYAEQTKGMTPDQAGPVNVEVDKATGTLLITANAGGMQRFTEVLNQVQQLAPPPRTTRLIDIQRAKAKDIVVPLKEFLASADPIDASRKVPDPTIQVIERTNSLMVTGEDAQLKLVQDYVQRLDRTEEALPPLKLLQLRAAESTAIAAMLNEQYNRRPQTERASKPVEVRADAATNTLIVSAHPDLFEEIKAFVTDINREKLDGALPVTEVFPLKVAKASDVAAAMDKLYPLPPVPVDRTGRPMPWAQKPKEVTVSADPNSNTLIINAPADRMEGFRALAEKLDRVELPPQAELKTYRVVGSNLEAIARTLNGMASRGVMVGPAQPGKAQVQVLIETEPKSSTLIVAGDKTTFERVESMLKDLSAVPVEKGLRIFPVANLRAEDVKIKALAIYNAQISQIPGANPVEVTVDAKNNTLMAVADGEAMQRFAKVMDELAKQAGPARDVRMIEIRFAKAERVKAFLDELIRSSESLRIRGGPDPVVEVIETSNSLMVAAQPGQFPIIEALVRNIDNKESTDRPPMRILKLRATDAANLASVLQSSFDRRPIEQRSKQPVDIQADAATNTLIVSADPALVPEIEQIVSELNQQDVDKDGREIRIFPLKVARAEELAKTIDAMYPEPPVPMDPRTRQPRPDLKPPKEVTVRADRGTNALIVDAPTKRLTGFEQIVKSLDQTKLAGNVELRSYKVERADLQASALALRNAAANGALYPHGDAGTALAPVTVDVEPTSRTLIVSGPSEVFKGVEEVLKKIDAMPDRPATGVKMYALKNGRAERLQPVLQKVLLSRVKEQLAATGKTAVDAQSLVEVAADAASNTIVVSAPENVLLIADAMMETLDQQAGSGATEMRVIRLTRGDAASAAKAIQSSLSADPAGEPAPTVTAEPSSNSVVIVGTSRQIEKAAKLVDQLDATVEKNGVGIRTIKLKHARAETVTPVLDSLLKKQSVVSMLPPWQVGQYLAQTGGKTGDEVRVAADRTLNAVVVSAPLAVLDMAEQVVQELDVDPAAQGPRRERPVRLITIQNADATELAANIEAVLGEPPPGEEPPTVKVDKASNSLIVRASGTQMQAIEELAAKVDSATLNSSRQMRMIPVDRSRADAALMAQTLKRLLEQQGGVKVEVISAEQLLRDGAEPPKKNDKPATRGDAGDGIPRGGLGATLAIFHAAAALSVPSQEAIQPEAAPEARKADDGGGVTIAVDPATNSLVIVGSPRLTDRLVALAAELERQMPAEPSRVRIVTLPVSAEADQLAQLIRQTVQQLGRSGPGNPSGFTGPVSVMADPAGTALIVWANDTDFQAVGDLIRAVSQVQSSAALTVKVYPLQSVTAQKAIQAVTDLISPSPRGRQAQRFRGSTDITLQGQDGEEARAKVDPSTIRLTADPGGASVIVAAPAATLPLIDRFIALIDQSPVVDRLAIRRYDLKNAKAQDLSTTLGQLFEAQRQGPARDDLPQARFIADARTNSILVTASEPQHTEVTRLLQTMDAELVDKELKLEFITLQNAPPSTVEKIVDAVVVGRNPGLKEKVHISAQDGSNLLVVRAPADQIEQIRAIVAQVDRADVTGLPVRYVKLERADAQAVATALQKFFTDRATAMSRGGQRQAANRVAVVGDRRSGTLIVSASDADYEQIQSLVATFDAPSKSQAMQFKIVTLQNARVTDIGDTIQNIANQLQWERQGGGNFFFWDPWGGGRNRNSDQSPEDKLFVEANEKTNSVVLMGQGDTLEHMIKIISELDRPEAEQTRLVVRSVRIDRGDLRAMARIVEQATATPGWRSWRGPDPDAVVVQVDTARRMLMLIGKQPRVEQAVAYVQELKGAEGGAERILESLPLKHAQAARAAETLRRVFNDRSQANGRPADDVSIVGSQDGNLLMVSADAETMKQVKDLLAQIDQPELGKDRQIEAFVIRNREADEIAGLIRAQFPRSQGRPESQVIVTPQPSTNMLIVSALGEDVLTVAELIKQLDIPPSPDSTRLVTVPLKSARADEVASALRTALPQGIKVKITPVRRNNTLLLTGSDETVKIVMDQIAKIDTELERPLVELKRRQLKNAIASDVNYTLEQMLRGRPRSPGEPEPSIDYSRADNTVTYTGTQDQLRDIDRMLDALDVPTDTKRKPEFVKLEFAKAEAAAKALEVFYGRFAPEATTPAAQNVTIVPDPASNSLVISAAESEWEGLRALLKKLDTEEYDTARQLAVLPLKHADATSVARALNEGFRAPVEQRLRRDQAARQQNQGNRRRDEEDFGPAVLVDSEATPTVSAEAMTNSLVVFAGRQDMTRIKALVEQIDVPDFVKFAEARVVPLQSGKASQIAQSVRELFATQNTQRGGAGPRSTVIVGDDVSNCLIIRAEERDFAQIKALAEALQQQGDVARATVRVLALKNIPAARLQKSLNTTFNQTAKQQNEVLSIEIDRTSNSLVVASSKRVFDEIEKVAKELDAAVPGGVDGVKGSGPLGQTIFIIDVKNNGPEEVRKQLEQLGVTRPQGDDRPGVVSEPVTLVPLASRRALAVIASPRDGEAVVALVRALDAAPTEPDQKLAVVGLKMATAAPLVTTLKAMLDVKQQSSTTGPAQAIAEQIRRLNVVRNGIGQGDLNLDLSAPIRLIADEQTNSVVIGSTPDNVAAVLEIIKTLDTLPSGDAVVIRIFPLNNASATRAKSVIDDLFRQGEQLRRIPGTRRQGLPTTATGKALAGEVVVSVDERTNTLVAAGREEAVALVEVLIKDLDSDQAAKWVEPALIPLKHADAVTLTQTLQQVLVKGLNVTPEALGLQRQVGRLRMAKNGKDLSDPANRVEADLFAPLSGLVIQAESQLNAIIVVGSTANTAVVRELVSMLDVEAASAANTVRVFPLAHAAADRVTGIVGDIFRQRQADPAARPEDRVILSADVRTNSLIVSTSPRSFSILEAMLKTLDGEESNNTVGLHVIPVVGADAAQLAPRIARLMQDRISASQRSGEIRSPMDTFSIEADQASNLLIVACSEENLQLVNELVTSLAQGNAALADAARTVLIGVTSGRAADVAATLRQIYVDKENSRRGANSVNIVANERLNALIVTGTEDDISKIRGLVDQQEKAPVSTAQDIRRIGLKSANALEVVQLLQNVLAGRTVSGGPDIAVRQATNLRFFRDAVARSVEQKTGAAPTEAQVDGAIRDQVTLTPDLRTNSVMVKAPTQVMEVIKEIIDDLDTTSEGARRVEMFTLKNADARQTAELLKNIFTLRQAGDTYILVPTRLSDASEPAEGPPTPSQSLTPVPDQRQQLSIAVDARTNTLIVSGTDDYLERVRTVVQDLDNIVATERESHVYAVRNAKAKDLETTLQAYFRGEADKQRQLLGPDQSGSVMRQLEQEVTVVGDEKSNKLVISTSPRYMEMVLGMVRELDAPPPQVMIQVLLAEVTTDTNGQWGIDIVGRGLTGENATIASLGAGAGVAAALGIPNLTFVSADFDLIVRALEAQGKLQILSSPYLQARNNEKASIQVGDNIAIIEGALERTPQGGTLSDVQRKDIGIILNVTPSISPDGFVRMEVSPEISQLSQRTTQLTEDFSAPIIQQRKVTTTVTVKDGQTVVIGGLMQSLGDNRSTKVPLLGDVPLFGWLFRTKQDKEEKTELLVILTPKVVYNDRPEADDIEQKLLDQKIDGTQSPETIRDMMRRNNMIPDRPRSADPLDVAPADQPPPLQATPVIQEPYTLPTRTSGGPDDTYVPPKRTRPQN